MSKQIVILAAGKGKRMRSGLPKVMHKISGISMLERVSTSCNIVSEDTILVVSPELEPFLHHMDLSFIKKTVIQDNPLGTAHAVNIALPEINSSSSVIIVYADNPLLTSDIISSMFLELKSSAASAVVMGFICEHDNEYGKLVLNEENHLIKIIESRDTTYQTISTKLCNSGIMAFAPDVLKTYLPVIVSQSASLKQEAYLTDIVAILVQEGHKISCKISSNNNFLLGVNTQDELIKAEKTYLENPHLHTKMMLKS